MTNTEEKQHKGAKICFRSVSKIAVHDHDSFLYCGQTEDDIKIERIRPGEMAQRLKALCALPVVLSSVPSNHVVAHNRQQ